MNREGYLHATRLQWHQTWIVQPLQYMQENAIKILLIQEKQYPSSDTPHISW